MTEQEQKAFTAMREALEQVEQQWAESGWGFRESIRTTVQQALTAANAVTSEYSEQPQDKAVKAAQASMAHYRETMGKGHPQATEPQTQEKA